MRISRIQLAGVFVAVLLAGTMITVRAHDAEQANSQSTEQHKARGVGFVRSLLTAEMYFHHSAPDGLNKGRYGSLQELQQGGLISKGAGANPLPIPGYALDLIVSADGQSFAIALHDIQPAEGGYSVFSNQSRAIYLGQPIR